MTNKLFDKKEVENLTKYRTEMETAIKDRALTFSLEFRDEIFNAYEMLGFKVCRSCASSIFECISTVYARYLESLVQMKEEEKTEEVEKTVEEPKEVKKKRKS